ncbi:MAG TPA: hemerythrin domain-containing protein [Candidatus Limnocylindrales bacterium]|nr:hemerythrin domain-containing protein [Candidatus Limnocylindrales bacterium]
MKNKDKNQGTGINALEMLTSDHDKVKELFREYEAAGDRAYKKKRDIAEKAFMELEVHTMLEEQIFYPAIQEDGNREDRKLVAESIAEHDVVKGLIEELKKLDPEDEQFDAKFKVLIENVEHHIQEEEEEMFPEAQEQLGEELQHLGIQLKKLKERLLASID